MTPEERAEARRLAEQTSRGREDDCGCAECRLASAALAALDALEAAEQERDAARTQLHKHCLDEACCDGSDIIPDLIAERDTARAQVATLVEALRWYAKNPCAASWDCDSGDRARAALKAAGVET